MLFRSLVILRDEMTAASHEMIYTTDDGSFGAKGLVTDALERHIEERGAPAMVIAIGPAIMMKVVCEVTRPHGIRTLVSLNPVMVDGTGMCGGCRVEVDGRSRFACVDGPEFDGHLVDFEVLMRRQAMYREQERAAMDRFLASAGCRLETGP